MAQPRDSGLNESQQRWLTVTCRHLDKVLSELEQSIQEAHSESAFRRYAPDLAPAEEQLFRAYVRRLRSQLVRILDETGLSPEPMPIGLRKSLLTGLSFVDIAVTELEPRHMTGYGHLAPAAAVTLNTLTQELHSSIRELRAHLARDPLRNLSFPRGRGEDRDRLRTLETLVGKYGLVEFRASLAAIADTISRSGLELAVFGRVNSGKSTLLNRLIGLDLLPVGITPITSVPTRIRYGASPRLLVTCAGEPARELEVSDLTRYASEQFNPGNEKRVLHLVLEHPAPLLESGVTLVDTPGLGSIDTSSTTETLAYMPYCDVAAVLVDAGATLAEEDVRTVAALLQSGVLVWVLLSRADLMSDRDRSAAVEYTSDTLRNQLQQPIDVIPLSTRPPQLALLEQWRASFLEPMIARQHSEHQRASKRKMDALASRMATILAGFLTKPVKSQMAELRTAVAALQQGVTRLSERERELLERAQAVASAAPLVAERMQRLVQSGEDSRRALVLAFQRSTGEAAADVSAALKQLAAELSDIRQGIARSIGWNGMADKSSSASGIRGIPAPAFSATAGSVRAKDLVFKIVRPARKHRAIDEVRAPLQDYAALLRQWLLERLSQLRADWESDTRALRAELDRRLGYTPEVDVASSEIEADLQLLLAGDVRTDGLVNP